MLHVRLLWNLIDPKQVPSDPSDHTLAHFTKCFSTQQSLYETRANGPMLIPPSLVQIASSFCVGGQGRLANQVQQIEENMLQYMQACLARFGLTSWGPDLRQTPYSLYNSACRIIALDTLKQALAAGSYNHLGVNLVYTQDMVLLIKLYDHFVHHYLYLRYKREARNPGSVRAADVTSPQYKGRARLADARLDFLKVNGYPKRYQDIIDPKATSDDELTLDRPKIYFIRRRPERSAAAERFIRILDKKREEMARMDSSKRWRERICRVPPAGQQRDSEFVVLPKDMPIDYFDPKFFNSLQPRLRSQITSGTIAFLPDIEESFSFNSDERLNDRDFMGKYGSTILSKYNLVDPVDGDEEEWIIDDDDDDMGIEDTEDGNFSDDDVDMTSEQNTLAEQLM